MGKNRDELLPESPCRGCAGHAYDSEDLEELKGLCIGWMTLLIGFVLAKQYSARSKQHTLIMHSSIVISFKHKIKLKLMQPTLNSFICS